MSEVLLLFAVLAALYLWECACWLPQGSIACLTWLGKKWRVTRPGQFFGNQFGGFVLAFPLPPMGSIVTGNQLPFSVSPEGIATPTASRLPAIFLPFPDIKTIECQGRKIIINGSTFLKLSSPTLADVLTRQISDLKNETSERRPAAIEKMYRTMFDTKAIQTRWRKFEQRSGIIRWAANGLFFLIFAIAPAAIIHFGLSATWLPLLIGILAFTMTLATVCYRIHKHFFPAADDDRFTNTVTVLLAPATALRTRDLLSRRMLEAFHPLAIACVFCPEDNFRQYAEKTVRDLRYSIPPPTSSTAPAQKEIETYSRQPSLAAIEKFLTKNKINPEDLCRAPKPSDENCHAYCPRCLSQFTTLEGSCDDCGGVPLVAFKKAATGKISRKS
jgi:hypothetical protein